METYIMRGEPVRVQRRDLMVSSHVPFGSNTMMLGASPNPIYTLRNPIWGSQTMGAGIDFGEILKGIARAVETFVRAVVEGIKHIVSQIAKLIAKIDWKKLSHIFLVELNPIHFIWKGLSTNPITGHLFRELDKFTGGVFTRLDSIATLGGRALRGDAIDKRELIRDVMFIAKVGLVIVSGGSAATIIAASSNQLKSGYLGQSELGLAILSVATVAALAYAAGESLFDATSRETVRIAQGEGAKELTKNTPLGGSELGRYIIGATTTAAGSGVLGENMGDSLVSYTESSAKDVAKKELSEEIGGQYSKEIASLVVEQGYPPKTDSTSSTSNSIMSDVWEEMKRTPDNVINAIKNFNISTSGPKIDLDPDIAGTPREGTGDPRFALPELKIPEIKIPDPKLPETVEGWEELLCKIDFFVNEGKVCAMFRKRFLVGGRWLWVYYLQDGTIYWTFNEIRVDRTLNYIVGGILGLALIYLAVEG